MIFGVSANVPIFQVNFAWANFILPIGVFKRAASHLTKCTPPNNSGNGLASLTVPDVSYGPPLSNQTGISAYAMRLGIPSQDIFGIIYLEFLSACGALLYTGDEIVPTSRAMIDKSTVNPPVSECILHGLCCRCN
jgi:hypothetical protein